MTALVVVATGPQALVVDAGRPGWAHIGVPAAGPLDGPALALANRLVANPAAAAGVEVLLGGLALRCAGPATLAVTGPPGPLHVDSGGRRRTVDTHVALRLADGEVLVLPPPRSGLRHYVAVAGGVDVDPVLGSRSADTLSGLGPPPLAPGTRLPVGPAPDAAAADAGPVGASDVPGHLEVPLRLGPRDDWFADPAGALAGTTWSVAPTADRIGVRLEGPPLARADDTAGRELRSEGLVTGAVQVPPDGRPVVFLADHPTTGGYPVVGVVGAVDVPSFAQARPGSTVRFVPSAR